MFIHRILNNNVVIVLNEQGQEQVVCGKGLAFKKKIGDDIDESLVNKIFILKDEKMNEKFKQLLSEIPLEHIQLADDIVRYAQARLGKKLNGNLLISLSDHMYSAMIRFGDGIKIKNAMLWDIRRFYETEFAIGMTALEMIEEKFQVRLPDDEAGFIALHIVNAETDEGSMEQMIEITKIMQEISNIVKYYFQIEFDLDAVHYYRFITHLKFFAQRLILRKIIDDHQDYELFELIKGKYRNSYLCVDKIAEFLKRKYQYELSDDEKLYLTIHIEKVIYKTKD